jgi:hypothetical protein
MTQRKIYRGVGFFAQYRPRVGAEADIKHRVEELGQADGWKALPPGFRAVPAFCHSGRHELERFEDITNCSIILKRENTSSCSTFGYRRR